MTQLTGTLEVQLVPQKAYIWALAVSLFLECQVRCDRFTPCFIYFLVGGGGGGG